MQTEARSAYYIMKFSLFEFVLTVKNENAAVWKRILI